MVLCMGRGHRNPCHQFTADAAIYEQLRLAQDMLRHQIPDGDVGRIIGRGLAALLRELARQKFAAAERPRMSKQEAGEARRARAAADKRAASNCAAAPITRAEGATSWC